MTKSPQNAFFKHLSMFADPAIGNTDDFLLGNTVGVLTHHATETGHRQFSQMPLHASSQTSYPASSQIDLLTEYGIETTHSLKQNPGLSGMSSARMTETASSSSASHPSSVPSRFVNLMEAPLSHRRGKGMRQYIIEFKNSIANVSDQASRFVKNHQGQLSQVYENSLKGFAAKLPDSAIRSLKQLNSIAAIYEDVPVQLSPSTMQDSTQGRSTKARAIATSTQSTPWGINRVGGAKNGIGKTVWIIDTGVDYRHPDLKVDTRRAKTFVGTSANDDNGHGTHVAGTIAALNNSIGVVGVAAGATVIPVKVLDRQGSGYLSNVIAGVDYVARYGKAGEVVNMSLGGSFYQPLNDAVLRAVAKGIKFAIAAGNENQDVVNTSPASTNGINIFTVSAIDSTDTLASFSNFGFGIDYAAPGIGVLSTWKGGTYATLSGTSMATPHVAGLLALGTPGVNGLVKGDRDLFNEGIAFGVV